MQALDVRMQALPVKEPEREDSGDIKRADAEPVRNGDSFLAMIKKMIAAAKDGSKETDEARFEDARLREAEIRDLSLQKEAGRQNTELSSEDHKSKKIDAENLLNSKEAYLKEPKNLLKKPKTETQKPDSEHLQAEKSQKNDLELNLKILNEDFKEEIKDFLPQDVKEEETIYLLSDEALKKLDKADKKKTQSLDEEKAVQAGKLGLLSKTDKKDLSKKLSS